MHINRISAYETIGYIEWDGKKYVLIRLQWQMNNLGGTTFLCASALEPVVRESSRHAHSASVSLGERSHSTEGTNSVRNHLSSGDFEIGITRESVTG